MSRRWTFVRLNVRQFLGVGFSYTALVAILREPGASLGQPSTILVLGLVWAVEVLWAPLLDRLGHSTAPVAVPI